MKLNLKDILIVILTIVIVFLALTSWKNNGDSNYSSLISYMEKEKEQMIQSNGLLVQEASIINQNLVSSTDKIKELSQEFNNYKKIQSDVKAEILSKIEGIVIPIITIDKLFKVHRGTVFLMFSFYLKKTMRKKHHQTEKH